MEKFKLDKKDFKTINNTKLFRIIALKDFGNVKKGDKGGYIEKVENLSLEGNCWVSGDARVSGTARISGDAQVSGTAGVYGDVYYIIEKIKLQK